MRLINRLNPYGLTELLSKGLRSVDALQPDINAWRLPVVGLVQNVHFAVAIEISGPRFVKAYPGRKGGLPEMPMPIAKENPGCCSGIIRFLF